MRGASIVLMHMWHGAVYDVYHAPPLGSCAECAAMHHRRLLVAGQVLVAGQRMHVQYGRSWRWCCVQPAQAQTEGVGGNTGTYVGGGVS